MAQRRSSGETQTQIEICIKEEKHLSGGEEQNRAAPPLLMAAAFECSQSAAVNKGAKDFSLQQLFALRPPQPRLSPLLLYFISISLNGSKIRGRSRIDGVPLALQPHPGVRPSPCFWRNVGVFSLMKFTHTSRRCPGCKVQTLRGPGGVDLITQESSDQPHPPPFLTLPWAFLVFT